MRAIIIKSISPEDIEAVRHLQAIEGYLDLEMFQEAEEELQELDPHWLTFEPVLRLRSRVYAGLQRCK